MNLPTAYTPLESLLLCQALRADGVHSISFNRISDQLKGIPLVRNDPTFDSGRLSPDALRELYLGLLKDEVKQQQQQQQQQQQKLSPPADGENYNLTDGHVSPNSRKRKVASPSLPTVHDDAKHSHLIPQLVTRLYARYRDTTVSKLQAHERKYKTAKQDIADIASGKRDASFERKRTASLTHSPKPSSTAHTQPILPRQLPVQPSPTITASPVLPQQPVVENGSQSPPKRVTQAKIDAVLNYGPEPSNPPSGHRPVSANTTLPPLAELASQPPARPGNVPKAILPGHQPIQPMPPPQTHPYTPSPPAQQLPFGPQNPHSRPGSISLPHPEAQQNVARPSSSPRPILPPPKGMQLPPNAPSPHPGPSGLHAPPLPLQQHHPPPPPPPPQHFSQSNRMPIAPSPSSASEGPRPYPMPPQPTGYYHMPQQLPYVDRRTSFPHQQQVQQQQMPQQFHQQIQPPPPHLNQSGGYMLPPFAVSQDSSPISPASQPHHRPQHAPHHTPVHTQNQTQFYSPVQKGPATAPREALMQRPHISNILNALATPVRARPRSIWKNEVPAHVTPKEVPRPMVEPLSPTLMKAASPVRTKLASRGHEVHSVERPPPAATANKAKGGRRKTNTRERSPHSVVSSTADDLSRARTRSQSVSTAFGANAPSEDRPSSRNGVKAEPSTPAELPEDAESTAATSGTAVPGVMTRKRRGTLQSAPTTATKRKRQNESPGVSVDENEDLGSPPPRSNTIIATRNFAKMSSAIMNDITSHKHASYFAKKISDKDIDDYSGIVKHPQDLKSIRSAITAGARAIAAASSSLESPSSTPSTLSTKVELERTADLAPPKAIVNGAQLEKELMRMFANAYLFNPGEDGMALSTKEMFEEVEQKIRDWRGTERLAGGGDDDDESKVKRRKL